MVYNASCEFELNRRVCRSCTWYIMLLITTFISIIMGISGACFYFYVKALFY